MTPTHSNTTAQPKFKILLCDDSSLIRKLIKHSLLQAGRFEIVAEASNGKEAIALLADHTPDCIVMDIEMPIMDGVDAVRHIRKLNHSVPILMFSTLTGTGSEATLDALAAGASDYAMKPQAKGHVDDAFEALKKDFVPKLIALASRHKRVQSQVLAQSNTKKAENGMENGKKTTTATPSAPRQEGSIGENETAHRFNGRVDAVAIGVSTGGPQALQRILSELPSNLEAPVLITQHMPESFIEALACRLDEYSPLNVKRVSHGEALEAGTVYIAAGNANLEVSMKAGTAFASLKNSTPENSCLPAVDPMFRTAAKCFGSNLLAIVLTGMGKDGLEGAKVVKENGGYLLVQDEATSVVWGMPGSCDEAGLPNRVLPIDEIGNEIGRLCMMNRSVASAAM
ncbi:MAG: chemotaxis-specific protein-glutamate methyltransferase CheB [Pirellulaceae bacterium]